MKKRWGLWMLLVILAGLCTVSAQAVRGDVVSVGLRYQGTALAEANLENAVGSGYTFGYFDAERSFVPFGGTDARTITMHAASGMFYLQLPDEWDSYEEAAEQAAAYANAYPAYINGSFRVRLGGYASEAEAQQARTALEPSAQVTAATGTLVVVGVTGTEKRLFAFDCSGLGSLGVMPRGNGEAAVTWFKGRKYYGGFSYSRITGGNLNVINMVDLEDYVKGVVPYEMSGSWPLAALEAQAVCARTYVCNTAKHLSAYGFDVCATTDCQVYSGVGGSSGGATALSDEAVDATAGVCMYYGGKLIDAVYFSSDGGATEDAENVWGGAVDYLLGKEDPYEALTAIPNYSYSVTYSAAQLTEILRAKGYSLGTVADVYVSERTGTGNVKKVTFVSTTGQALTVSRSTCRSIFYSSTYGKSVRSMRFTISGGSGSSGGNSFCINDAAHTRTGLDGLSVISGSGTVSTLTGTPSVITASGTAPASGSGSTGGSSAEGFTVNGTGNGHNVGMSQYGAKAMAETGCSYRDILNFYYTGITIG